MIAAKLSLGITLALTTSALALVEQTDWSQQGGSISGKTIAEWMHSKAPDGPLALSPSRVELAYGGHNFDRPSRAHQCVTARRMERAMSLLADPDLSVTRIGHDLGFVENSSFTTSFRKHVGITPTAYRRSLE